MTDEITTWVKLTNENLASPDGDDLREAVANFHALSFDAGRDAEQWLKQSLTEEALELDTRLALDDDGAVLGFYALGRVKVPMSLRDLILLSIRRRSAIAREQPGSLIAWIARSASTEGGFGGELIDHALAVASEEHGSAFLVAEAHTQATENIWRGYRFMSFTTDSAADKAPQALWHPVDELKGGGWPS